MNKTALNKLINNAKKGDSNSITELYLESKDSIYFTCLKMVNNEQDALDLTQETFITVFSKLDTLKDNINYFGWQKTIAINKCKKYLLKNKEVLFRDNSEENNTIDIEDNDEEFIPHSYIDNIEKRNIIMNILDNELSDIQRVVIMLFYYEEKSINEIAEILECSVGTVKSRLHSAKRLIKNAVDEEEAKGNKLYTLAPIPVLTDLLRKSANECKIPKEATEAILDGIKASLGIMKGGSIISKIGLIIKEASIAKLVTAGLVGTSLIVTGVVAVANNIESEKTFASVSSDVKNESKDKEDKNEKVEEKIEVKEDKDVEQEKTEEVADITENESPSNDRTPSNDGASSNYITTSSGSSGSTSSGGSSSNSGSSSSGSTSSGGASSSGSTSSSSTSSGGSTSTPTPAQKPQEPIVTGASFSSIKSSLPGLGWSALDSETYSFYEGGIIIATLRITDSRLGISLTGYSNNLYSSVSSILYSAIPSGASKLLAMLNNDTPGTFTSDGRTVSLSYTRNTPNIDIQ